MPLLEIHELEKYAPIFRGKLGNLFGNFLLDIFSVSKINRIYDSITTTGPAAAKEILDKIKATYVVGGLDKLQRITEKPFITISNHPYGGLDGIILIDLVGHLFPDFKVMVNTFLSRIKVLDPNFITVIPTGEHKTAPTLESLRGTRDTLSHIRGGHPMGFFPSGAVSDLSAIDGNVRDREWQEPVLKLIRKAKVPIIPIRFFDGNSKFYYKLGLINWKVRLLKLPSEVLNKKGTLNRVGVGDTISVERQSECTDIESFGKMLRSSVYDMPLPETFIPRSELPF